MNIQKKVVCVMEKIKKLIGKFKDESPDEGIESFVGIRSKNAIHSKLKIL